MTASTPTPPTAPAASSTLVAFIGDIHGRFHRVQQWLAELELARDRRIDLVLAVGDVEAFRSADEHKRKAAKRAMPAEFSDYAEGKRPLVRALHFIGGNNEDFENLHAYPSGGLVAPDVHYLGRAGVTKLAGLTVAYLSGIHAARYLDKPLLVPDVLERRKQAGYFRTHELGALADVHEPDVMLVHEWPRGIVSRAAAARRGVRASLKAWRFPWIGNPITRTLVEAVRPSWLFCGHSHLAFATVLEYDDAPATNVVCLDQAANPEGALFWIEFRGHEARCAGWGTDGEVVWRSGEDWDESRTGIAGR